MSSRPVAIVTGASSGIGEASARTLAAAGFRIALAARRTDRLEALGKELDRSGCDNLPLTCDLADEVQTQALVDRCLDTWGRVDLLVNNAGFSPAAAIEQLSRRELRETFDVNLLGGMQLIGALAPGMRAQGGGRIVNVGSLAASVPAPLAVTYAATKAAMEAATAGLRLELAPWNIRLSLVVPGFVATEVFDKSRQMGERLRRDPANPYRQTMFDLEAFTNRNLRNAISPEAVAAVVLRAATERRPRERYYVPFSARLQRGVLGALPERWLDSLLLRLYKVNDGRRPA